MKLQKNIDVTTGNGDKDTQIHQLLSVKEHNITINRYKNSIQTKDEKKYNSF